MTRSGGSNFPRPRGERTAADGDSGRNDPREGVATPSQSGDASASPMRASGVSVGDRVRAPMGSVVAGTVVGFTEAGQPIVRWDNGAEGVHGARLVKVEA
jgi:hypothetical protein